MRILMVSTLYPPMQHGGAEKFVSLLAEGLVKSGHEVSVVTLHTSGEEITGVLNGVRVHRVPLDNIYWPFDPVKLPDFVSKLRWHAKDTWNSHAAARVARILDIEQPDVVHTHGLSGFSVAVWAEVKKRNIRLVHTLHDFYLLCRNSALFTNGKACAGRCRDCEFVTIPRKWAASRVDNVVSISQYVLNTHLQYGYFCGVPSSLISNIVESDSQSFPSSRDLADDTLIFGYIGRVEQEKGIDVLLKATQQLRAVNWRLLVAGSGKEAYVAELKRRFPDPRIEWLGFVDPWQFYHNIDVTVVPSVWPEPLGRTVIEAFAAQRSAICAKSGGIPETAVFGKTVETYPSTDIEALAAVMNGALADPPRWRDGGYRDETAKTLFSEAHIVNRYRAIYSDATERGGRA